MRLDSSHSPKVDSSLQNLIMATFRDKLATYSTINIKRVINIKCLHEETVNGKAKRWYLQNPFRWFLFDYFFCLTDGVGGHRRTKSGHSESESNSAIKQLMGVEPKNLNPENEMKKIFGSRHVGSHSNLDDAFFPLSISCVFSHTTQNYV